MEDLGKELFYFDLILSGDDYLPYSIDAYIIMDKALKDKAVTTRG
jgi:hypothetical protein